MPPFTRLNGKNTGTSIPATTSRGTFIYSGVMIQFQSSMTAVIASVPVVRPITAPRIVRRKR